MMQLNYFLVDVFATGPLGGNQLAVFLLDDQRLPDELMQAVAREMNLSETTFVLSGHQKQRGYDVRIFTPEMEIPFAGHPSLGTAAVIHRQIDRQLQINLNLGIGQRCVRMKKAESGGASWWLETPFPELGKVFSREDAAKVIDVEPADISEKYPCQQLHMGVDLLFVPVKTLAALKKAGEQVACWKELSIPEKKRAVYLFTEETIEEQHDFHARLFAAAAGVTEDPATGSAGACLAGYLFAYHQKPVNAVVEQGHFINRPSLITIKADCKTIQVGGTVYHVGCGQLTI